ncbi:MAG: class I SAM-dependent methyltransferase [Pseudomonadota bacterium]|nr:class I SAM-dependent methyltransferase [Pseudomonadota bacterium]
MWAGDPSAAFVAGRGFRVTGIDADPAMLAIARLKALAGDWWLGNMRTRDLLERFSGLIGWDSFFHLTQDEQRAVLPRLV